MLSGSGERISGKITRLIQGTTNDGHTEEEMGTQKHGRGTGHQEWKG